MQGLSENAKKRILVVDDDTDQLEILRNFLEPTYIVGTVSHGEFVLDYIREYNTDLILMDIVMPDMDGFATLRAIRSVKEGNSIPVIFITGKSTRNIVLQSINVGIDGYMIKPVSKDALLEKVKNLLAFQSGFSGKKTVLTVDDDITYLKIMNDSLKERFNVIMLNTTKLAKEYLKDHVPDVILMSNALPKDPEGTLFEQIKEKPELKDIPVIMLTGLSGRNQVQSEEGPKPDKYLLKPVSKLDLMKAIISAINAKGKI
ncbi:MAG: response regulator [Lachnospiraceae bacterium]|nr:response regulator [Lachnospiraceae bacterium]